MSGEGWGDGRGGSLNGVRVGMEHVLREIGEVKDELKAHRVVLIQVQLALAGLPGSYASGDGVRTLAGRVDQLEAERDRASGGMRWLSRGLVVTLTVVNLMMLLLSVFLAGRGKVW